jgi:quercetin dioxygenase-like cupin family protein
MIFKLSEAKQSHISEGYFLELMAHSEDMFSLRSVIPKGTVKDFHAHSATQIYIVEKGKMKVTIGEETEILCTGDSALVPSNVPHRAEMLEDTVEVEVFNESRKDVLEKWFSK